MKKYLATVVFAGFAILLMGCSDKEMKNEKAVHIDSGAVSKDINIGSKMKIFTFKDQFDKPHSLSADTKNIIFVFKKASGHSVKEFLDTKPLDYLSSKNTIFVADVSKMPSLIREYIALPDLRKHKYPILLIFDEEISKNYVKEKDIEKIMVVNLENLEVTGVTFLCSETDLENEIK